MRLLLVEDTVALADQLLPLLRDHGYAVDWRTAATPWCVPTTMISTW